MSQVRSRMEPLSPSVRGVASKRRKPEPGEALPVRVVVSELRRPGSLRKVAELLTTKGSQPLDMKQLTSLLRDHLSVEPIHLLIEKLAS